MSIFLLNNMTTKRAKVFNSYEKCYNTLFDIVSKNMEHDEELADYKTEFRLLGYVELPNGTRFSIKSME